jgi:hypothetical protein
MTGDSNHHGIRDIGDTLKQGFTTFAAVIRLMAKADPMEMSDDFFELANKGSDWFMDKEARCLDAYALLCFEKLTVFEAKYGPINFEQNQERFQQEVLNWGSLVPAFNDFYQVHVEYEKLYGEQKIELRNKRQALLLTNGDVLEKKAGGDLRKKGTAMTVVAAHQFWILPSNAP